MLVVTQHFMPENTGALSYVAATYRFGQWHALVKGQGSSMVCSGWWNDFAVCTGTDLRGDVLMNARSKTAAKSGRMSSKQSRIVPECQTHPENQIRLCELHLVK